MKTCIMCGDVFNEKGFTSHIKHCKGKQRNKIHVQCPYCNKIIIQKTKNSLSGHKTKCIKLKELIESKLTKDFLYNNLIVKNLTSNYIALHILKIPEISAGHIIVYARKFGIQLKNLSQSSKIGRSLAKETCLKNYGVENPSQLSEIKEKKKSTFIKHYGVDNIFKSQLFKDNLKKYYLENYGVEYASQLGIQHPSGRRSRIHKIIELFLNSINIKYESEKAGKFLKFNEKLNRNYSPIPDIVIDEHKIVIEIYGDMWHANPRIYKSNDIIYTWDGPKTSNEIHVFDEIRKNHIISFGYKVIELWEYDIINNLDVVKESIKREI